MTLPVIEKIGPLIHGVDELVQIQHRLAGFRYGELNRVGHLLILPVDGRGRIELSGIVAELRRGYAAWIAESEWLRIQVLTAPWSYVQVRFLAPGLPTPPAEQRIRRLPTHAQPLVADLQRAWDARSTPVARQLRVHGLVSTLLGHLLAHSMADAGTTDPRANPWWSVESSVRTRLAQRFSLADLVAIAGVNRLTLERAARTATGLTPIRRLRQIRMAHAQTLMRDTRLLLKEVAAAVGYPRIHEFSRDYCREFGSSPRRHRADGFPSVSARRAS